jgi:hypothetical protein
VWKGSGSAEPGVSNPSTMGPASWVVTSRLSGAKTDVHTQTDSCGGPVVEAQMRATSPAGAQSRVG